MKNLLVILCLAAVTCSAQAQIRIMGSGADSCGNWNAEKKEVIRQADIGWVLGYLSGVAAVSGKNFLKGYDVNSIAGAIDKFCRDNPLKNVDEACDDVAIQMVKAMKR
jgi:hypothetical protein